MSQKPVWNVGVARRTINPPPGVQLAGLGYYLQRVWQRVRDDLTVTALVISDENDFSIAIAALDLMYNDAAFTGRIREMVASQTNIRPESICINCSHSHNAPTAGFIRGCGEQHEEFLQFAARQAAEAIAEAWRKRERAKLFTGNGELRDMTFNRARPDGPVDSSLGILRADSLSGRPLAVAVNFNSHCTAHMEADLLAISRDWPGEVVEQLEAALPGVTAMYWQGVCGDVNFRREFNGTERRFEPAKAITKTALGVLQKARPIERPGLSSASRILSLPTRRWERAEVLRDREEGLYRLKTGDITGWMEGVARNCVGQPERLPLRYGGSVERAVEAVARFAVEWTGEILPDLDARSETLAAEAQVLRIGDLWVAANPSELFTSLGLEIRANWPGESLFILSYSNGSTGYLPDAPAFERPGYATVQSPKFTGQFPFTPKSGLALVAGTLDICRAAG